LLRARRALVEISEDMVRVSIVGGGFLVWSFFGGGRCSWLAWEGRCIQTSTERTGPFKFFTFPTLTSSSVRWVVTDVSYIISDDIVMSPPKAAGHGSHLLVYYPSSQGRNPAHH